MMVRVVMGLRPSPLDCQTRTSTLNKQICQTVFGAADPDLLNMPVAAHHKFQARICGKTFKVKQPNTVRICKRQDFPKDLHKLGPDIWPNAYVFGRKNRQKSMRSGNTGRMCKEGFPKRIALQLWGKNWAPIAGQVCQSRLPQVNLVTFFGMKTSQF